MAKTPKIKRKGVSVRSRAARRESSPSVNLDKPITAAQAPVETADYKPRFLGVQNAGISKKKAKPISRQQRLRREKGFERADANLLKLEKKLENSRARSKIVKSRAAAWEELNERIGEVGTKKKDGQAQLSSAKADEHDVEIVDAKDVSKEQWPRPAVFGTLPILPTRPVESPHAPAGLAPDMTDELA